MFFWFKKKEVVLDCFTACHSAYEYAKPDFAYKFLPEWFVKLPKEASQQGKKIPTAKNCHAIKRLYTANTIIIPMPYLCVLEIGPSNNPYYNWKITSRAENSKITSHSPVQYDGLTDKDYQNIKFASPWKLKTNRFVEFFWADPVWNRSNLLDYTAVPGILNFKYQHTAEVNMFVRYEAEARTLDFTIGDPMAIMVPLTECNIKIKHHIVDEAKIHGMNSFASTKDTKVYSTRKRVIEEAEKRDAIKKCPFHLR